jgi:hypothetical protein
MSSTGPEWSEVNKNVCPIGNQIQVTFLTDLSRLIEALRMKIWFLLCVCGCVRARAMYVKPQHFTLSVKQPNIQVQILNTLRLSFQIFMTARLKMTVF